MNRYEITYDITERRGCVVFAESESAARQTFIDDETDDDRTVEYISTEILSIETCEYDS